MSQRTLLQHGKTTNGSGQVTIKCGTNGCETEIKVNRINKKVKEGCAKHQDTSQKGKIYTGPTPIPN